jgi:catechol-2,3-dioxygenase
MGLSDCRVDVLLAVSDLDKAMHFYEHQLGLVPSEAEEQGVRYLCGQGMNDLASRDVAFEVDAA